MRISDWSSDVCSSDLTGRDDDGKTYYKAWDEHDSHSVVIRPADHCGVDYVAYKVLDDDTLSKLDQRLQDYGVETRQIPAGAYPRSGRRIEFTLPTGHIRSEEHKYELQSLMRISFAVFCLKKKNFHRTRKQYQLVK